MEASFATKVANMTHEVCRAVQKKKKAEMKRYEKYLEQKQKEIVCKLVDRLDSISEGQLIWAINKEVREINDLFSPIKGSPAK